MTTFRDHYDARDGKIYRCVLMPDGKWWFATNLAWAGAGLPANLSPESEAKYGRQYAPAEYGLCAPVGTHVPKTSEWDAMLTACGYADDLGNRLKAVDEWGWRGTDFFGFSALPAGSILGGDYASNFGSGAFFAAEHNTFQNWGDVGIGLDWYIAYVLRTSVSQIHASVRCVVDTFVDPPTPFSPSDLLPLDGITFSTQKNDGAFTPELAVQRRTNGPGRAVFTTSLRFALTREQVEPFKDWFDQHPGGTMLFSQFPLGGGNIDFISTAAPVYTNTHSGVEASVEGKAVPYWPWLGVGGEREILPVVCPFPLGPVSGLTDGAVQPMVGTSGTEHSVAVASARMVGLRLSLNMSPDCMAWFMQWWSDFTDFGRKKFIASIGDRAAWLWRFASEPVFSMNGLVATASFSLQGRPTSQVLDVGPVANPVPTSFTSFLGGTFDPARTYCAQAFDSNGDPVDPQLFVITEQTTTYLKLESSLPVGTYRYVVYGASRISPWYFLEVRTFGH